MPIRMAMEALTFQTQFFLFNSRGSSSKCFSSVGFCAALMQQCVILGVLANGHLFHDVVSDMSINPDHKSFGKSVPGYLSFGHTIEHELCILPM